MKEKNILAYFHSPEEAEGAAKKLQSLRVVDFSIDRVDRFAGEGNDRIMNPITGNFDGLGELTLDADFDDSSSSIMAAADVTASGMSDGGQGGPSGRDVLLTVVVSENEHHRALQVIEQCGGKI